MSSAAYFVPDSIEFRALRFWNQTYLSGIRIVMGQQGKAIAQRIEFVTPIQRLKEFGGFGFFPKGKEIEMGEELKRDIRAHSKGLRYFLTMDFGYPCKGAWHVLSLDYEVPHYQRAARQHGFKATSRASSGGHILLAGPKYNTTELKKLVKGANNEINIPTQFEGILGERND